MLEKREQAVSQLNTTKKLLGKAITVLENPKSGNSSVELAKASIESIVAQSEGALILLENVTGLID